MKYKHYIFFVCICAITILINTDAYCSDLFNRDKTISMNKNNVYAIKSDNTLYRYDIHDGEYKEEWVMNDVKAVYSGFYAVKNDNSLWLLEPLEHMNSVIEDEASFPVRLADNVKSAATNGYCSLILSTDGDLQVVGEAFARKSQMFTRETFTMPTMYMHNVMSAATTYFHTMILKTDGGLYSIGYDTVGESGKGNESLDSQIKIMNNVRDIIVNDGQTYAIRYNNDLYRCGSMYFDSFGTHESTTSTMRKYADSVNDVVPFFGYNIILKTDNTMWIYGSDEKYEWTVDSTKAGQMDISVLGLPNKITDDVNSIYGMGIMGDNQWLVLTQKGDLELFRMDRDEKDDSIKFVVNQIAEDIKLCEGNYDYNDSFEDKNEKADEFKDAISSLRNANIIKDSENDLLIAQDGLKRAEAVDLILRLYSSQNSIDKINSNDMVFSDVDHESKYYDIIVKGKTLGIVSGFENNEFRENEKITWVQFVSMIAKFLKKELPPEFGAMIIKNVPEWSVADISYAIEKELISPKEIEKLNLSEYISVDDALILLYRLYQLY